MKGLLCLKQPPCAITLLKGLLPRYLQFRRVAAVIDVEIISRAVIVVVQCEPNLKLRYTGFVDV